MGATNQCCSSTSAEAQLERLIAENALLTEENWRLKDDLGLNGDRPHANSEGFDDDQKHRLRRIFEMCDLDGSGDLTLAELTEALKKDAELAREYGLPQVVNVDDREQIIRTFESADADGSGLLSWAEFYEEIKSLRKLNLRHPSAVKVRQTCQYEDRREEVNAFLVKDMLTYSNADVNAWRIEYWNLAEHEELQVMLQPIKTWDCLVELNVLPDALGNFFTAIKKTYRENPYHNFQHALATMHYAFKLAQVAGIARSVSNDVLFAIVIGGLCHDCDHRGRNTAFEVMTLSTLALRYNDKSPLENHHCATAFEVALGGGAQGTRNIFQHLKNEAFRNVRQYMVSSILGTDMKFHNDHVKQLSRITNSEAVATWMSDDPAFVAEIFLHTADICNPMMPPDISEKWGQKIAVEFTAQVEEERALGIPVTSMMDGLTDPKLAAMSQLGFINFILRPLTTPLFVLFPDLEQPKVYLEGNCEVSTKKSGAHERQTFKAQT